MRATRGMVRGKVAVTGPAGRAVGAGALSAAVLRRLEGDDRVRAVAAGRHEQVVEVLHGGLRVERHDRVLELLGAHDLGQVAGHQEQRVAHGELAAPDVHAQRVVRRRCPGAATGRA